MAAHKPFTMATAIQVFFCDPKSPSAQRKQREHKRHARKYMPKGIEISGCLQYQLNAIERQLRERPRKSTRFRRSARGA